MFESGYYPAGAENDPRAPWNEPEPKYRDVKVTVEYYTYHDEEEKLETKDILVTIEYYGSIEDYSDRDLSDMIYEETKNEVKQFHDDDFEIINSEFV